MFGDENIDYPRFIEKIIQEISTFQNSFVDLIRVYFYDAVVDESDPQFSAQTIFFSSINMLDNFEVRLGRLKKDKDGAPRQKGVDTLLAIDILTKAYTNQFDLAVLVSGDEDFLDAVMAIKNMGKRVYGVFFINHISRNLESSFDKKIRLNKDWINPFRVQNFSTSEKTS